jgi:hypothetical protein
LPQATAGAPATGAPAVSIVVVVVVVIEFLIPARMLSHRVDALSERCRHCNDSFLVRPGYVANRNPIRIRLLMLNANRFSDYDNDNDNDNDNECIAFFLTRYLWL